MNLVEHVVAAIRDADKVAVPLAAGSGAVLFANWVSPDLLAGLPTWVLPTLHIVCIFSTVFSVMAPISRAALSARSILKDGFGKARLPFHITRYQKAVSGANIVAKYQLLYCVRQTSRKFVAPEDHPVTLWMLDTGIAKRSLGQGDRLKAFEITPIAWRALLLIDEFYPVSPAYMKRLWDDDITVDEIRRQIPERYLPTG